MEFKKSIQEEEPNCAGVIVFSHDCTKCLLVKSGKKHKNYYSFPKGKRNRGERWVQCAFREMNEETGLTTSDLLILKGIVMVEDNEKIENKINIKYLIAKMRTNENKEFTYDKEELSEVRWFTIEEALSLSNLFDRRKKVLSEAHQHIISKKDSDDYADGSTILSEKTLEPKKEKLIKENLVWILKYKTQDLKLKVCPAKGVTVQELLSLKPFRGITADDINYVINKKDNMQFIATKDNDIMYIKLRDEIKDSSKLVQDISVFQQVEAPLKECIYLGNKNSLDKVRLHGIITKDNSYIQLLSSPIDDNIREGVSIIYVYINMKQAMDDGMKFYHVGRTNTLWSPGFNGIIDPKYFKKIVSVKIIYSR